jgi:hypothetical protein
VGWAFGVRHLLVTVFQVIAGAPLGGRCLLAHIFNALPLHLQLLLLRFAAQLFPAWQVGLAAVKAVCDGEKGIVVLADL